MSQRETTKTPCLDWAFPHVLRPHFSIRVGYSIYDGQHIQFSSFSTSLLAEKPAQAFYCHYLKNQHLQASCELESLENLVNYKSTYLSSIPLGHSCRLFESGMSEKSVIRTSSCSLHIYSML
jgi:hypothetical protein